MLRLAILAIVLRFSCTAAAPPTGFRIPGVSTFLSSSPCNMGCWTGLIRCELVVACRPSSSTEPPDDLVDFQLSALLSEAAKVTPTDSRPSCPAAGGLSLRLDIRGTSGLQLAVNATALAPLRVRFNGSPRCVTVTLRGPAARLIRPDPAGLARLLGGAALVLDLDAGDPSIGGSGASVLDFGGASVSSLHVLVAAPLPFPAATSAVAQRTHFSRPHVTLRNLRVSGSLAVTTAPRTSLTALPLTLSLEATSTQELRISGYTELARPQLQTELATSLRILSLDSGADLADFQSVGNLSDWAPGLQVLRLANNSKLARAALSPGHFAQLLSGNLLSELRELDLRGYDARLRLPALEPRNLRNILRPGSRCSELRLQVDDDTVMCDCRLAGLLIRCLGDSIRWCVRQEGSQRQPYAAYHRASCMPTVPTSIVEGEEGSSGSGGGAALEPTAAAEVALEVTSTEEVSVSRMPVILTASLVAAAALVVIVGVLTVLTACSPFRRTDQGSKRRGDSCSIEVPTGNGETESVSKPILVK